MPNVASHITLLPPEIWVRILRHLDHSSVARLMATSNQLRSRINSNYIWYQVIVERYGAKVPVHRARHFYWKLFRFATEYLGISVRLSNPFEGVMWITYEDEAIKGYDIQPPPFPHLYKPVKYTQVFEVRMEEPDNELRLLCTIPTSGSGSLYNANTLTYIPNMPEGPPSSTHSFTLCTINTAVFSVSCDCYTIHTQRDLRSWWLDDTGEVRHLYRQNKFHCLAEYNLVFVYYRMGYKPLRCLPFTSHLTKHNHAFNNPKNSNSPFIKPGLYIGSSGINEFDMLLPQTYVKPEEGRLVPYFIFQKLTGDTSRRKSLSTSILANLSHVVPCDLSRPLKPVELFVNLNNPATPITPGAFTRKRFVLPENCIICRSSFPFVPRYYIAAFPAKCFTCSYGSSVTSGLLIWFNEKTLGFLCSWKLLIYRHVTLATRQERREGVSGSSGITT